MLTDHNEGIIDTEHATVREERLYTAEEAEIHDKELCALKILQEYKNGICPPPGSIWSPPIACTPNVHRASRW